MTNCGSCSLCCKVLTIYEEPEKNFKSKPWNTWCVHCKPGSSEGGCTRHEDPPQACEAFQCVWLQSHRRQDVPHMSMNLKPSISKVILVQSQENYDVLFAFCDPAFPAAWKLEPMRSHLIKIAEVGCTVIVVVGTTRYIMTKGRATIKLEEGQLADLVGGSQIKISDDSKGMKLAIGRPSIQDRLKDLLASTASISTASIEDDNDAPR